MTRFTDAMRRLASRSYVVVGACVLATVLAQGAPPSEPSQATTAIAARALFEEGKALFEAGKVDEACPKFQESQRVQPDTGTLLALATCHRDQGRHASAWAEFTEGERRARLDGNATRERYAREEIRQLLPRLSTVHVVVSPALAAIPGLLLSIDEIVLPPFAWNSKFPLDGGTHTLRATAPHRDAWQYEFQLGAEADSVRVTVEMLPISPQAVLPSEKPRRRGWSGLQWAGVGAMGVGAIGLGVTGYFIAIQNPEKGLVPMVGGLAAALAGLGLFYMGSDDTTSSGSSGSAMMLSFSVPSPGSVGLIVNGSL